MTGLRKFGNARTDRKRFGATHTCRKQRFCCIILTWIGENGWLFRPQAVEDFLAPHPKPAQTDGSDLLDAMEAMKSLVASLGKEQVKRIVDSLG